MTDHMQERYQLLNYLYHMIATEQSGGKVPQEFLQEHQQLATLKQMLGEVAAKLCYVSGGELHATTYALAKLFTAGLVSIEREADGEVRLKPIGDPDLQVLQDFNDSLKG